MTDEDLDELERVTLASTPGLQWSCEDFPSIDQMVEDFRVTAERGGGLSLHYTWTQLEDGRCVYAAITGNGPNGGANARFFAGARGVVLGLIADVRALRARRDELLATVVRVSRETPYPAELRDWEAQRGAVLAEVGTLRARVRELEAGAK